MNTYIIIFSLNQPGSMYTNLYTYLKSSGIWAVPFQGVYFVGTTFTAVQIRNGVQQRIYQGDKVLVVPVQPNNWGTYGMTKEINDWLKNRLS